mmetsp:Transcript_32721/g.112693  ORF Transcript_32721/g.112693 Transcript_32721/m.112693 type:complete len:86 (+) Transcript_32721:2391-2648(+)
MVGVPQVTSPRCSLDDVGVVGLDSPPRCVSLRRSSLRSLENLRVNTDNLSGISCRCAAPDAGIAPSAPKGDPGEDLEAQLPLKTF